MFPLKILWLRNRYCIPDLRSTAEINNLAVEETEPWPLKGSGLPLFFFLRGGKTRQTITLMQAKLFHKINTKQEAFF
jgi:hypothetical protein